MATSPFSLERYFTFNLEQGELRAGSETRALIIDRETLVSLVQVALTKNDLTPVRALGVSLGRSVLSSLGAQRADDLDAEKVIGRACTMLGAHGWGRFNVARWGQALVVTLEDAPSFDSERLGIGALLGGVLSALVDREVACVPVGARAEYLVLDPSVAEEVWSWSKQARSIGQILDRLQPGASS